MNNCKNYKSNTFIVNGEVTTVLDSRGNSFIIDTEDIDKVKEFYWYVPVGSDRTNVPYHRTNSKGQILVSHHLCIDYKPGMIVDHINRDQRDNRKCNLRCCTVSQNDQNRHSPSNNCTGYVGVHLNKRTGRYNSQVWFGGRAYNCGTYDTPEEAYRAYCVKKLELCGDYAPVEVREGVRGHGIESL